MKLDGGAMFGIVPKSLWQKQYQADENNMVAIVMRSLLVVDGNRRILFDNGIGDKQDHKFFRHYYLFGDDSLAGSLARLGLAAEDITDMVLTHLHFDHCGGSIRIAGNSMDKQTEQDASKKKGNTRYETTFPNARYWVSRLQWDWAQKPNKLEGASFLDENINPIKDSGQLELFDREFELTPNIQLRLYDGHTVGQAIALVHYNGKTIVNNADLIPMLGNIKMSWVCGYDIQPLVALEEKRDFLKESLDNDYIYYFYHDLENQCCTLKDTIKGILPDEVFDLESIR
jgi:glyoxylase-like metal-dependent hydrolase (beta-lactamase superfamily II)